jgi:hypothetical protein
MIEIFSFYKLTIIGIIFVVSKIYCFFRKDCCIKYKQKFTNVSFRKCWWWIHFILSLISWMREVILSSIISLIFIERKRWKVKTFGFERVLIMNSWIIYQKDLSFFLLLITLIFTELISHHVRKMLRMYYF